MYGAECWVVVCSKMQRGGDPISYYYLIVYLCDGDLCDLAINSNAEVLVPTAPLYVLTYRAAEDYSSKVKLSYFPLIRSGQNLDKSTTFPFG